MSAINKVKYQQFVRQAKGVQVNEVHVKRADKGKTVQLHYNARPPKGRQRLNGVWAIARDEKSEEQIVGEIKEFLGLVRKDFFVKRGEGLQGDALADETMEAKGTPIVSEKKD